MIEPGAAQPFPPRTLRVRRSEGALELFYPPLRTPDAALPLAAFGALAAALPVAGAVALLPRAFADTAGILTTVLVAAFIAPFGVFGAVVFVQALYMLSNTLRVRVDALGIVTRRSVLGVTVRRQSMAREDFSAIEAVIASRHQTYLSAATIYQLVAVDASRTRRVVVAESLRGEALMHEVKALVESELSTEPAASDTITT